MTVVSLEQRRSRAHPARPDVHLVVPPYAPLEHPSLATGVLKAALLEAGLSARVTYLNLTHADEIGLAAYSYFGSTSGPALLGEWSFAAAAFPDAARDDDAYFELTTRLFEERYGANESKATIRVLLGESDLRRSSIAIRRSATALIDRSARALVAERPRMVGCSSTFQQHCASLALLRRVKELDPEIVTLLGGGNCDGPMGRANFESFDWLDYVVTGEADVLIGDLCRRIAEGTEANIALPAGVYSRRAAAAGVRPSISRAIVDDMDAVAVPDVDEYFEALGTAATGRYIRPTMLIETSRGCWWGARSHCVFCGLNGTGMDFRSKSADRVVREFEQLATQYGTRQFAAVDNILDMKYFDSVLPRLAASEDRWDVFYETKANLSRAHVRQLYEAGVTVIQPGIESLHDEPLRRMAKGNTAAINVQLLKWCREFGIGVTWFVLGGLPDDEDTWYDQMADLAPLLFHLIPPLALNTVEFHRFSPYHDQAERFGLKLRASRAHGYIYPVSAEALDDLAYVFERVEQDTRPGVARVDPGKRRLSAEIAAWQKAWLEAPPALLMRETDDGLSIVDTRPCAPVREQVLGALQAQILRACDSARQRRTLMRSLGGVDDAAFEQASDELIDRGLLISMGGRMLALPTNEILDARHPRMNYGFADVLGYLADRRADQLQARASCAGDIALKDLFSHRDGGH